MSNGYSRNLLHAALDFLRAANREMPEGLGQERVYAMMDAFDPSLKKHMLMELMGLDNPGNTIRIERVGQQVQQINAIKAIRAATGFGLREAKDVVDNANTGMVAVALTRKMKSYEWDQLRTDLSKCGYRLL